jgi:integrase
MTWGDVRAGRMRVAAQQKTGAAVDAPLHPDLVATLAAQERRGVVIVMTKHGAGFTTGFGNWMADAIAKAGLQARCVTHGVRKAAARRLAEAGCTPNEIMAITGHRTLKEVERYTADASRTGMADVAMAKVVGMKTEHPACKPHLQTRKRKR